MDLIVIPTYNERRNIEPLLRRVWEINDALHVLVVDDNSPDGTAQAVAELMRGVGRDRMFLLSRPGKLGLGTAYVAGFKWALARDYARVLEMDADFSHDPAYLPALLQASGQYDLVLGSRYVPGGGVRHWGPVRRFISRGGSLYARTILGLPFRDLTGGYKCFRREVLAAIDLDAVRSNGYAFQIEMTYRAYLKGFRIAEIPIVFADRTVGKSKMSRHIFLEAVGMVWRLRLAREELKRT